MPQHITAQKDFVLWGPFLFSELLFEKKKNFKGKTKTRTLVPMCTLTLATCFL